MDGSVPTSREPVRSGPLLSRGAQVGRYLIIDKLGAGGMGEVFSAYDPQLDRRIALKLVKLGGKDDAHTRERLLREAQALAKLNHPNVVAVYDAGTHGTRVFIAMEYVEGTTMGGWITEAASREGGTERWREGMALMLQAGRGLAAAHAQGLVHRDFKPANIMVSEDGRVRVLDFGLARRFGEVDLEASGPQSLPPQHDSLDGSSGSRSSLNLQLTQTGMVMGTPSYMAPEQFYGGSIDERTDQFSFCIVLYRALCGERPFLGNTFKDLGRAVANGQLQEFPKAAGIPRVVQAAIRKGLSVAREGRYDSMDELLAVLERSTNRGRRRALWMAGAAGVAALAGALVTTAADSGAATPCTGAEAKLQGIWDDARRESMQTAFAATALPYAEDARAAAQTALDEYTEQWVEQRTEICEATRVSGDQSEALMDLRIGCLDGNLRRLNAMTRMFAGADADVVKNATLSVGQLPPLQGCSTLERDDQGLVRPDDPAVAEEIDTIRDDIATAWALALAGKYQEAEVSAAATMEAARQSGYQPVIAECGASLGQIYERQMKAEPARAVYQEAIYAAAASGHTAMEAQALVGMLSIHGTHLSEIPAALHYGNHAEALVERMGSPIPQRASIALYRGNTLMGANQLEQALEQFQTVIEIADGVPAAERIQLAAFNNVAAVMGQQGKYHEALASLERAATFTEARLGPWHPFVGQCLNNVGVTQIRLENYEAAAETLGRAVEIYDRSLRPDHPELGRIRHNLGVVQASLDDIEGSYASYRKALELKTKSLGPDHTSVALTANNVGDALIKLGRPAEAIPYIEDALRIWTKAEGEDGVGNTLGFVSLAEAHLALGQDAQSEAAVRRALALADKGQIDPINVAKAKFVAARAIWATKTDREEAVALAREARAGYEASDRPSPKEIARIDRWLAKHG